CTFCRKLHREIQQYTDAGIEIRYLMYPRGGPGSRAWAKAEDVLCSEDRNDAMTRAKNDEPVEAPSCAAASVVMDHYRLGQEVGLRGTPAIVLGDGEMISGYLPANELAARLAGGSAGH
ncbi:MAG: DsbC family protein, partial [Pseudomonadota bacterium]